MELGCSCVHDDVRKLIKYSMEDMLAPAAADQALEFWHTIVDPFFGLPPQQREPSIKVDLPQCPLSTFRLCCLCFLT